MKIESVGSYLPNRIYTNKDLEQFVDTSNQWIVSHTGIKQRHYVTNEKASDLAINAILSMNKDLKDVDAILVATATPDYNGFPSTACVIAERLNLKNVKMAFDFSAGCTGFIYGLELANSLIVSKSVSKVLVVASEVLSKVLDFSDRSTCVLFGDGAGVALVTAGNAYKTSIMKSEANGSNKLTINEDKHITMDGRSVYNFAVKSVVKVINDLLSESSLSIDDIAWIVPHQANLRIIQAVSTRLDIPIEKFYSNISKVANTSASSIPIALCDMEKENLLNPQDNILLVGFGAGLIYGGSIIQWKS